MRWLAALLLLATPANSYMDFNGVNNFVWIADGIISDYPLTVSFWYRSTTSAATAIATAMRASSSSTPVIGFLRVGAGDGDPNCGTFGRMKYFVRSVGSTGGMFCADPVVTDGTWHFIAGISVSSTTHKLRVDETVATVTDASIAFPPVNRTAIGAGVSASSSLYEDADIEDVRIYNRVLSDAELDSLQKSRSRLHITDGLVGYWPLDDGADGVLAGGATGALDRSGNGKHMIAASQPIYRASDNLNYP